MRRLAVVLVVLAACSSRQTARTSPPPAPEPREAAPTTTPAPEQPRACPDVDEAKLEAPGGNDVLQPAAIPPIVDPKETMGRLYDRLVALARGTSKTPARLAMYGDSNHKQDMPEAHLRRALQARFGDAGHGWVPLARPHWLHHQ